MLHNRFCQFLMLYISGIMFLFGVKVLLGVSNYVIPSLYQIYETTCFISGQYVIETINTMSIAMIGHMIAICAAISISIIGRFKHGIGSFITASAYQIQAYPIVAIAPIIFILLGDGIISRLLIAALICYFPLLLTCMGIFTEPVKDVEHFYITTNQINWKLQIKIRAYEHFGKILTVIEGSATTAIVGTIVAEFISSDSGIGRCISIALSQNDLAKILIALFLIGIATTFYLSILEFLGKKIRMACHITMTNDYH